MTFVAGPILHEENSGVKRHSRGHTVILTL